MRERCEPVGMAPCEKKSCILIETQACRACSLTCAVQVYLHYEHRDSILIGRYNPCRTSDFDKEPAVDSGRSAAMYVRLFRKN